MKERKGENECEVGEQINTEQGEEKKAKEINQIKKCTKWLGNKVMGYKWVQKGDRKDHGVSSKWVQSEWMKEKTSHPL